MYCSKCGAQIEPHSNFCPKCGEPIPNNDFQNTDENNTNDGFQNNQSVTFAPTETPADNLNTFDNPQQNQYTTVYTNNKKQSNTSGVASLILGIVSLLTSLLCLISVPTGIAGLILGIKSKAKSAMSKIGIVLSSIGLFLSLIFIIAIVIIIALIPNTKTYYGDGFSLEYDKKWSVTTLANEQEALKYKNENSYLAPIGVSALSQSTTSFSTDSGKDKLYQDFYDYWNDSNDTLDIFSGSDGFSKLTDEIYYATYNYGVSSDNIKGKYILLVSEEMNAVLSFMSNSEENVEKNDARALELLKDIEILYQADSADNDYDIDTDDSYDTYDEDDSDYETIYDDELYNSLDNLRNWNRYSQLREGKLGKSKSIKGGWRILSDSETYWEFKDGEFWWYESVDNLSDNYWYGKTEVLTGKTGLATAGIDASKIDEIIDRSSGNVTANDIYTIVCTPTKIISGGIDKSDTNIPDGTTWTYVWIIVDHGSEGIEAQVLNLTNYEASYYVKIKD